MSRMASDDLYILAVDRERREEVPDDWVETVRSTPGVAVLGAWSSSRVQVRASPEAIQELEARLGGWCHIEKPLDHERLTSG